MIPDIQTQLNVVIKSLKDNVAPAVDPENRLAQEQLFLSLATLDIALAHLPLVHQYVRKDISDHISLATSLASLCSQAPLQAAIGEASSALLNPERGFTELQSSARSLREAIGLAIDAAADSGVAEAVERAVLTASIDAISMGRAWNKPMGFEPKPDDVQELAEQLSR